LTLEVAVRQPKRMSAHKAAAAAVKKEEASIAKLVAADKKVLRR